VPKPSLGITANEAARILDTTPDAVLLLSREGVLTCLKANKRCWFEPRDIKWLKLHFNPGHPLEVRRLKRIRNAEERLK